jgi:hypothetical protein
MSLRQDNWRILDALELEVGFFKCLLEHIIESRVVFKV